RALITFVIAYLLTLPFLKRVRATAANFQMMVCGCLQYDFLHRLKLPGSLVDITANIRRQLQHTFGDIVLYLSGRDLIFNRVNQH
ncbi:hypothetical protein QC281_36225, partial [Streptomyces sp. DH17]|nr:hypothetical protein [Streptomyces sp. DH17]